MNLLYLALAYTTGVVLGRIAWESSRAAGWFTCPGEIPGASWLWLAPLAVALFSPLLDRLSSGEAHAPLRWPESAGFVRPRPGGSPGLLVACALCLLAGILRYASAPITPCPAPTDLAYYNTVENSQDTYTAPRVRLDGYVSSYPTVRDTRQQMVVQVEHLLGTDGLYRPVSGLARVNTDIQQRFDYGDGVQVVGILTAPRPIRGSGDWAEYLARQDIYSVVEFARVERRPDATGGNPLHRALYTLRRRGEQLINRLLPEPYAALANGVLLGINAIPQQVRAQFDETGTSHVLVISGSNVALVAGAILLFARRIFGRNRALLPALLGIAAYVILVGAEPPVLRAGVMGGLVVFAAAVGRQSAAIIGLAAASWAMTLYDPALLWDAGFHLSVSATAGLLLFTPGLSAAAGKLWPAHRREAPQDEGNNDNLSPAWTPFFMVERGGQFLRGIFLDSLIVTIAANIGALPVVVYHFGRISAITLPANMLIAPVQPWIMALGMPGILLGVAGWETAAQVLLWGPWLALRWTWAVARWGSAQTWASGQVQGYGPLQLALTYAVIAAIHWRQPLIERLRRGAAWFAAQNRLQKLGGTLVPALLIANLVVWQAAFSQPDGRLHIHFLDVDRGGTLIVTPSGRQLLIDGGSSPAALYAELGKVMPFWDRSLDIITYTQADAAHATAQAELPARFDITLALETPIGRAQQDTAHWRARMAEAGVDVQLTHAGGWIDLGDGVALWVLWPEESGFPAADGSLAMRDNTLLLKLVYGDFRVLFTGDSTPRSQRAWVRAAKPLDATVLALSPAGAEEPLLNAAAPQIVVIQGGEGLDPVLADRLEGRTIHRNDLHGRIHIATDARQIWIETER